MLVVFVSLPGDNSAYAAKDSKVTVLFTHDTHDYLYPTSNLSMGELVYHGGAAKLTTLLKGFSKKDTIYVDSGDFAMGTLFQAAYSTDAYELRNLGILGCSVVTLGNHEFDYGATGIAKMLDAAVESGDELPEIVQANIDFSSELTGEQKALKNSMDNYGVKDYVIKEVNGISIGIFGVMGYDSISCVQSDVNFKDYIETSKAIVDELKKQDVDLILCLSHSGTEGDGENGEDIELAKEVPEIDIIISGHSHSSYSKATYVGKTLIASCGEYLENLGKIVVSADGNNVSIDDYSLIPIDDTVENDHDTYERISGYRENIDRTYLKEEGVIFNQVICHSDFDLIDLSTMYATHQEYTMGNVIADSYIYEAQQNGIYDIDVALVGLGTIRSSIKKGDIKTRDAFEICSLGVGSDGSCGHPLVCAYVSGKELKLLTELDASLGNMVSSIKMSYSGLSFTYDTKRVLLDRVTDVHLVREDGTTEEIKDNELYKVCANMYAINMLGMLNGLTKGILSIAPKNVDGEIIEDFYEYAIHDYSGEEVKEWVALKDYLMSFDKNEEGISELPEYYAEKLDRKITIEKGGLSALLKPGKATNIVRVVLALVIGIIILIALVIVSIIRLSKKKKNRYRNLFH